MTKISKCLCGGEPQVKNMYVCTLADRHGIKVTYIACSRCDIRTTGTSTNIDGAERMEREKWNSFMGGHHA